MASATAAKARLTLPRSPNEVWAWLVPGPQMTAELVAAKLRERSLALHVAVGGLTHGTEGFRTSHQDARRIQAAVMRSQRSAPTVTTYEESALVALLTTDAEGAAEYVRRQLGPLAGTGDTRRQLRETLRVFLRTRSYAGTAEHLAIHRNTVLYRVQRAEQLLGRPVLEHSSELSDALLIAEWTSGNGR